MYGSVSWALDAKLQSTLDVHYLSMIRRALKIPWSPIDGNTCPERKRTSNSEVMRMSDMEPTQLLYDLRILSYAGHVARMDEHRHPNKTLFGILMHHRLPCTNPPYVQAVEKACERSGIPPQLWKTMAQNRNRWAQAIKNHKEDGTWARKRKRRASGIQ